MMLKKLLAFFTACLMMLSFACAEESVTISEIATVIGENHVRYPQLEGLADAALQSRINDDIVMTSGVSNHLITLVTLGQNPWKLQVDHQSAIVDGRFFSTVISARGKIGAKRDAHQYTALCYDLTTGEKLTLEELFADVDAAVDYMEAQVEDSLSEELNGYLEYSDITPLPRTSFTLDETGITFWYPSDQFSLLSGYAGAVQFWYEELEGFWKDEKTAALSAEECAQLVKKSVEEGSVPNVPAAMGQKVSELTDAFRLLREPDEFPGGRYYVLEDPAFRSIHIISDALQSTPVNSVVEGIQLKRGGLHGLLIGKATQEQWRVILGNPVETVTVTENMAYDYRLPEGEYDVYHFGSHELRMHADESGVLCAVQICNQ